MSISIVYYLAKIEASLYASAHICFCVSVACVSVLCVSAIAVIGLYAASTFKIVNFYESKNNNDVNKDSCNEKSGSQTEEQGCKTNNVEQSKEDCVDADYDFRFEDCSVVSVLPFQEDCVSTLII